MAARVLLVDDHRILRDGLRMLFEKEPDFLVVDEAGDAHTTLEIMEHKAVDLVVMDLLLPDGNGIACTRNILERAPQVKILVLSANPDQTSIQEALQAGASGYVFKDEACDELLRASRTVLAGKVYLSPSAATHLVLRMRTEPERKAPSAVPKLSDRELAVLKLIAEGLRNKEIAARLDISSKSVETYRARLMSKLGCSSVAELVRYAVREGISSL